MRWSGAKNRFSLGQVIPPLLSAPPSTSTAFSMSKLATPGKTSLRKGLQRDPSYYSSAWKQRQQQLRQLPSFGALPRPAPSSGQLSSQSDDENAETAGASLRRILEDYLEIDPDSNIAVSQLLGSSLLVKYFRKVVFSCRDLIFDIEEAADEVREPSLFLLCNV